MARLSAAERLSLTAVLAAAAMLGTYVIHRLPISTDEVFALWMVRDIGPAGVTAALGAGAAGDPVGYYDLLWLAGRLFGESIAAFRAVSLAAFGVFVTATHLLARRVAAWPVALAASTLLFATEVAWAGVLARPYALAASGVAVAWLLWLDAPRPWAWRHRVAIAIALGFAVAMQFYAVVWPAAMLLAEAARSRRERRWHAAQIVAIGAGWLTLLLSGGVLLAIYRHHLEAVAASSFFAAPSLAAWVQQLASVLADGHRAGLLVMLCAIGAGTWRARRSGRGANDVMIAAILVAPVVTLAIAFGATGHLVARHFYPVVIAAAAGLAAACAGRRALFLPVMLAVVILAWRNGTVASMADAARESGDPRVDVTAGVAPDAPIIVADGSDFLTLVESAPAREWWFATLPDAMAAPDPEPELFVVRWAQMRPGLRTRPAAALLAEWPSFLVLDTGSRRQGLMTWLAAHGRLLEAGRAGDVVLWRFEAAR
jgi:hypothetical protein